MRIRIFLLFLVAVNVSCLSAQNTPIVGKDARSAHSFIAEIIKVDTVITVSNSYLEGSQLPEQMFTKIRVAIKILRFEKSPVSGPPKYILMDINNNEHSCRYQFVAGRKYRINADRTKYTSSQIKNKYRNFFWQIDCNALPAIL